MLLRETGTQLHLLSALSPQWLAPGKTIEVQRGATFWGKVDLRVTGTEDGALVTLSPTWREAPNRVVIHIPFWVSLTEATADTGLIEVHDQHVILSAGAHSINLKWTWGAPPDLSYAKAVRLLVEKYMSEDHTHLLF